MICESGSSHSAKFLQVTVSKKGSQLCAAPTWKPTALGIPLAEDSAHPKHVHESWPTAVVTRLIHISTHLKDAKKAHSELIQRFRRHHASSHLVRKLEMLKPWKLVQLKRHLRVQATARTNTSWLQSVTTQACAKNTLSFEQVSQRQSMEWSLWNELWECTWYKSCLAKQSSKSDEQSAWTR